MAEHTTAERDPYAGARENAKGWLASIEEMIAGHTSATEAGEGYDEARDCITESVLSVQVRSGWCNPGALGVEENTPEEYEILLSTGGPALRIWGHLDQYCQPTSAELQMQDWGTPWGRYPAPEATLLAFAQFFWFGE